MNHEQSYLTGLTSDEDVLTILAFEGADDPELALAKAKCGTDLIIPHKGVIVYLQHDKKFLMTSVATYIKVKDAIENEFTK
jgi:hypothetical protein